MGSSAVRVLALSAGTLAGLAAPTAAFAAPHDPPGNNGTIKVDAAPFDDAPNNEPHVDCVFQIDFYGFDEATSTPTSSSRGTPRPAGARC